MEELDFKYITEQNDTWDLISFKIFGTEFYARTICKNNPTYMKTVIFPAGIELDIAAIKKEIGGSPEWA